MRRSLPFAFALVTPLVCALAIFLRGPWLLLPPAFLFVLTPLFDLVCGRAVDDIANDKADAWRDARFDVWLWLWLPLQLALQVSALAVASSTSSIATLIGLAFASGMLGGLGINVAHEWMHRKGTAERAAAAALLASVSYGHFQVEHVLGHHKHVGTERDPGTARVGDVLYGFVLRSVVRSFASAWRLAPARVARGLLAWAALVVFVALAFGVLGVALFLAQSAVAIALLEAINYIEHYGLVRAPGTRVRWAHSWSSPHRLTSLYLFNLPRHADHHAHASRPYFALRHVEEGPQMPAGYAAMLVLALVPPLWRSFMHDRLANVTRTDYAAPACAP
ncbi:MAG TPA: alkane 1-monooxygenase [Myxococcota bacterium]|jgi:alkane 1-monooxygenase